jgi:hypothetical protein
MLLPLLYGRVAGEGVGCPVRTFVGGWPIRHLESPRGGCVRQQVGAMRRAPLVSARPGARSCLHGRPPRPGAWWDRLDPARGRQRTPPGDVMAPGVRRCAALRLQVRPRRRSWPGPRLLAAPGILIRCAAFLHSSVRHHHEPSPAACANRSPGTPQTGGLRSEWVWGMLSAARSDAWPPSGRSSSAKSRPSKAVTISTDCRSRSRRIKARCTWGLQG